MQEDEGEKWLTKEQVKKHRAVCRECEAKARAMHEERRCANRTMRKAKSEFRGEQWKKHHAVCEERCRSPLLTVCSEIRAWWVYQT